MPHVSDVRAASPDHARHDLLLVAALAAGDTSGTDRDHALDLTRSCAACAELHDDLVAIARATASVPPPIADRPRDFRLTPADAARLRPAGWRRLVGGLAGAPGAMTRPLGVGLATLGLVGLVIGNAPAFSFGSSAATPHAASSSTSTSTVGGSGEERALTDAAGGGSFAAASAAPANLGPVPAASPGQVYGASTPAASQGDTSFGTVKGTPATSEATSGQARPIQSQIAVKGVAPGSTQSSGMSTQGAGAEEPTGRLAGPVESPFRPANIAFGLAVIAGLGLLIASRLRRRQPR